MPIDRRRFLGCLPGLMLLPSVPGLAAEMLLAPELQQIATRGELRVAMPGFDSPPFFFQGRKGTVEGIDPEIARGIARVLGVPARFMRQADSFNGAVEQVARREADLAICKISRTLARARLVRFSDPYFTSRHALLINRVVFARQARGRELAEVVRQFDGSLGVIRNSAFADLALQNFPKARLVAYDSWNEVLEALQREVVMAAYRDELEMRRLFQQEPTLALTLRLVALKDTEDALVLALPPDAEQLLALTNLYLAQTHRRLEMAQVLRYGEGQP